ncbi:MAG: citrate transporter [Anaerocolumna sp.]|jgi:di/tricarboxylate transporter|nr:citrate transporter [Anaerocolumna sp.]
MKDKVKQLIKKELVLIISSIAAIITMFFVPPTSEYFNYIDYRVLGLLFCLMAVIAGLQKNGIFLMLSETLLKGVTSTRKMCYILILLCFFSSMWITNDVALITFVPFTILILHMADQTKYLIYCIVMETIGANLGSMLTPVGNPQNLYLYSFYKINGLDFIKITLPFVLFSLLLLIVIGLFVKNEAISIKTTKNDVLYKQGIDDRSGLIENNGTLDILNHEKTRKNQSTIIYIMLFLLSLGTVLRFIDYRLTLIIVVLGILLVDRSILKKVDYSLLFTFVSFFVFVGNIEQIDTVRVFIADIIKSREVIASLILSQVISNVPAAVLLSNFTLDSRSLIIGTNVGGLGTIIASLASLISYKFYSRTEGAKPLTYLGIFTFLNIILLLLMIGFYLIIR